jgi:hypothetical protein
MLPLLVVSWVSAAAPLGVEVCFKLASEPGLRVASTFVGPGTAPSEADSPPARPASPSVSRDPLPIESA